MSLVSKVGFVAIGRNEGDRLKRCLDAVSTLYPQNSVVYVDSGSSDQSVKYATSIGVDVVELDMSIPFTAARARNAGYQRLLSKTSDISMVQFLDGDCELSAGWIETAVNFLESHREFGIVSGRRKERFPEHSIYNTLIDIEWNTAVGETSAVLGDMLVRVSALNAINGFDEKIIAAEDDDFCLRARARGFKVFRIDHEMSTHDANMILLSQWYKRSMRGGHGYANIYHLHGGGKERHFQRNLLSVLLWGGLVPLAVVICMFSIPLLGMVLVCFYFLMWIRLALKNIKAGTTIPVAFSYAALIYTGKIFEFFGVIRYLKNLLLSRKHQLIEYK